AARHSIVSTAARTEATTATEQSSNDCGEIEHAVTGQTGAARPWLTLRPKSCADDRMRALRAVYLVARVHDTPNKAGYRDAVWSSLPTAHTSPCTPGEVHIAGLGRRFFERSHGRIDTGLMARTLRLH